jgi:uncharacterized protein YaaN involved in tellurite resistance
MVGQNKDILLKQAFLTTLLYVDKPVISENENYLQKLFFSLNKTVQNIAFNYQQ